MSVFTIPEQYVNSTRPIPLFEIEGVEVGVPLLPSDKAEEWAEKARAVDKHNLALTYLGSDLNKAMEARVKATSARRTNCTNHLNAVADKIRAEQAAKHRIVKACLDSYPGIDKDTFKHATMPQRSFAFELLRAHNDPFVVSASLGAAASTALLTRLY